MTFGDVTNSEHCDIDDVPTRSRRLFFEARCEGAEPGGFSEDFDPAPEAVLWVSPGVMAPKTVPLRPAPPAARYPES